MDIFATMITPYTSEGKVDYKTALRYVDWYFENGLTGIFSICQSSEIFYLSLEERVKLNKLVYERAKELESKYNRCFTVVSSGHISDTLEKQAEELNAVYESGTDALILITNRIVKENEDDNAFIQNCEELIDRLPENVDLGLYECPYPYKRLVSPKILEWCKSMGRFKYMKDTCCDSKMIADRCNLLKGSDFKLLNANCQTLFETLKSGCDGYCGIMCNYHPRLYAWLCQNFDKEPEKAELVQSALGSLGFIESGLPYPLTAKYHMCLCGIETENFARNCDRERLTDYVKDSVKQMKNLTDYFETITK